MSQDDIYPKRGMVRFTFQTRSKEEAFNAGIAFLMELGSLFPVAGESGINSYSLRVEIDENGVAHPVLTQE